MRFIRVALLDNFTKVVIAILAILCVGCSRRARPEQPAAADVPAVTSAPPVSAATDEAERRARDAEEARRLEDTARNRATLERMVFFDYDRWNIREDARSVLDAKLPVLRANAEIRIRIEGHADERGSVEYNLALSLRRAQSVRAYLQDFGISVNRMEIVGYGEERPFDSGTTEAAFARNRRAEFRIVAGLPSSGQ